MSVQATSWVWEHSHSEGTARLVLLAIADAANKQGGSSYQSAETLAEMCRISSRTVRRQVQVLRDLGEVEVEPRNGSHGTNSYRIPGVLVGGPVGHDSVLGHSVRGDKQGQSTGQTGSVDRTSEVSSSDIAMSPNPRTHRTHMTPKQSAPPGDAPSEVIQAEPGDPALAIAKRAYDATRGALKFMAVREVAKWAIEKRGETPARTEEGLAELHHMGKPITRATLDQWFNGSLRNGPWHTSPDQRAADILRMGQQMQDAQQQEITQ